MSPTEPRLPITVRDYCLIRDSKHPRYETLASRPHGLGGWEVVITRGQGDTFWIGATYAQFIDAAGNPIWSDPENDSHMMDLRPAKTRVEWS